MTFVLGLGNGEGVLFIESDVNRFQWVESYSYNYWILVNLCNKKLRINWTRLSSGISLHWGIDDDSCSLSIEGFNATPVYKFMNLEINCMTWTWEKIDWLGEDVKIQWLFNLCKFIINVPALSFFYSMLHCFMKDTWISSKSIFRSIPWIANNGDLIYVY